MKKSNIKLANNLRGKIDIDTLLEIQQFRLLERISKINKRIKNITENIPYWNI